MFSLSRGTILLINPINIQVPTDIIQEWQEIVNLISNIADVPAGLIMRLEGDHIEVFVSSESKDNPYRIRHKEKLENSGLYCEAVIKSNQKLLLPNALADEKWKNNPDLKLNMISYLGYPILLPNEQPFGTICVLDNKPNAYSDTLEILMMAMRNLIEKNLEIIFMNQILGDENKRISDYLNEIQAFRGIVPICSHCKSIRDSENNWHSIEEFLFTHPKADFSHGICPKCLKELYPDFLEK